MLRTLQQEKGKKGKAEGLDRQIGERLKAMRKVRNMTQEDLASQVGITFQQIQKYENGKNRVSASRLHALSRILGIPLGYFFENFGNMGSLPVAAAYGLSDNTQESLSGYSNEEVPLASDVDQEHLHELIAAYYCLDTTQSRHALVKVAKEMANKDKK
ncbi:MAG: helix-turn-helix domain-containing protein [Alphaproteobacteria bacterium]|nr:helix-turn-helix domain-containing protein [Alphaproteobacteria bacterium]